MQALSEEVVSPLPECFMEMDIMSDWGHCPYLVSQDRDV